MVPQKKYRLPDSQQASNSKIYWLLTLLVCALIAWIWRYNSKTPPKINLPPQKSVRTQPSPRPAAAASMLQTNLPMASGTGGLAGTNGAFPKSVQNLFEAQLALDRMGISAGSIDGKPGPQTRAAVRAFQSKEKIATTGELDAATKAKLLLNSPPLVSYTVTSNDLARLQPLGKTWLAKSQQTALDFETLLELVAEQSHAHPGLIRQLNPNVNWTNGVAAGTVLQMPDAARAGPPAKAALVKISLSEKTLEAFDADTNLLAHFPCSIAQRVEKRPVGELVVTDFAARPNYTFDPAIFPESPEAQSLKTKLILPPGPNNPVGLVWISLDKPGYGLHGTPSPELVGRTESHGCFRLANWNAEFLLKLVWIGMPVRVDP